MKKLFTESLENRLLKYSITAGVVIVSQGNLNATIYTHTINKTLTDADNYVPYSININPEEDSNNDFKFSFYYYHSTPNFKIYKFNVHSDNTNRPVSFLEYTHLPNASGIVGFPYALNSGDAISANALGGGKWHQAKNERYGLEAIMESFGNEAHFTNKTAYVGVRFYDISNNLHYGWIKIHCTPSQVTIISDGYESTPNTGINAGVLPVELTSFTANNLGNKVELNWHTATEVNNYGFDIERSAIGSQQTSVENWEKIGFVPGNGNSNSPKDYSFVDKNPIVGTAEYRLKQIDNDGAYKYSTVVKVSTSPEQFELSQNYPNPFNPTTTISYAIPKTEHVSIVVYDELGREVRKLVDEDKGAGKYNVRFNGSELASGIYYYRIDAGEFSQIKKLMLLK